MMMLYVNVHIFVKHDLHSIKSYQNVWSASSNISIKVDVSSSQQPEPQTLTFSQLYDIRVRHLSPFYGLYTSTSFTSGVMDVIPRLVYI